MNLRRGMLLFLVLAMAIAGCAPSYTYHKCGDCEAAYRASGGLPGQVNTTTCRQCGGKLFQTTKKLSGWDDDRFEANGDEIK